MKIEIHLKKIGLFFLVISTLLLTNCNSDENKKEIETASDTITAHTYREMINRPLIGNFGKSAFYDMVFKSDSSFYWKNLKNETQGDEKTKTIILDDYKVLTHWIEKDSTIVSILTDFENMTVNGFETLKNHKTIIIKGKLTVKK